jgi:hypothetical protein
MGQTEEFLHHCIPRVFAHKDAVLSNRLNELGISYKLLRVYTQNLELSRKKEAKKAASCFLAPQYIFPPTSNTTVVAAAVVEADLRYRQ